jgi:hypothetical protein
VMPVHKMSNEGRERRSTARFAWKLGELTDPLGGVIHYFDIVKTSTYMSTKIKVLAYPRADSNASPYLSKIRKERKMTMNVRKSNREHVNVRENA